MTAITSYPKENSLFIAFSDSKIKKYNITKVDSCACPYKQEGDVETVRTYDNMHKHNIVAMALSVNGKYLYSYAYGFDKSIKITNIEVKKNE